MGKWWRFGITINDRICLGRVLIVDDEESIRQVLRTMPTNAGYDAEEATRLFFLHQLQAP